MFSRLPVQRASVNILVHKILVSASMKLQKVIPGLPFFALWGVSIYAMGILGKCRGFPQNVLTFVITEDF